MNELSRTMRERDLIRNVSIIAHVDHGKTALTESLTHVHMDVGEEKERGITIKSAAVSLQLSRMERDRSASDEKQQKDAPPKYVERQYLINLIDSPGHVDFSSEVTAALRITDGAICVVDCIEGVAVQTETVLRQALMERVRPVLFLNKVDRIWLSQHLSLVETYKLFRNTIESSNVICSTYQDKALGSIDLQPRNLNVAFGSGYFAWGFTLETFADMYCSRFFGLTRKSIIKRLWGNHYFDAKNNTWSKLDKLDESRNNAFCEYVLKPIQVLHDAIMTEDSDTYLPIIEALGLAIKQTDLDKCENPKQLLKLVMSTWLPVSKCVVDLCADQLPSPGVAQRYRVPALYTGPLDSTEAQDMMSCNPDGKLSMYVSKMIPIKKDPGRFIAFGRVFSGTVKRGQELRILSGESGDSSGDKKKVQGIIMMMGAKAETLGECPAGNVCGLMGINKHLAKSGTLCDSNQVFAFKTMQFSVAPVVNVAVNVVDSRNLKKLVDGLQLLSQYDNIVQIKQNKQGQQIVAGSGELHLQTCLRTLQDDFMKGVPITTSQPIVSYCEGIAGVTGSTPSPPSSTKVKKGSASYPTVVSAKSVNKHNRLFMNAQPLQTEVCHAIESGDIHLTGDVKAFGRDFAAKFPHWHKDDAAKIWTFGCAPYGRPNVLVDQTKGVDYLDKTRSSLVQGFLQVTNGGALCDEPLRGVRFNMIDGKFHPDPPHRSPVQVTPMARRACMAGLLASTPVLLEPVYEVDISVPTNAQNGVFSTFGKVRGEFVKMEQAVGLPMCRITGHVPILETLKNAELNKLAFTELLRENTKGQAFAVMKFSHWQCVEGDPLKDGSICNKFIMEIRKRKGMKMEIPCFYDFYDKL